MSVASKRRRKSGRGAAAPRPAGAVPHSPAAPALPIAAHAEEIAALIEANPVVVVAGETGSGKSTQLPRICLPRCRDNDGMIAHTQPRRIAAREVAARVSAELGMRLGDLVGYKVRFGERTGQNTRIKVLTDGMLLAEMERDRDLRAYHTIIVDEAHERSINIDFLLGYLKRLVRRRRDLRVVVTSATIDTARFAGHFDDCPVVSVSGRGYPVEVLYRPRDTDDEDGDALFRAIESGIAELWRHGPGDVLVFLPGEREIREASDYLRRRMGEEVELLPLFARLSPSEQKRIFRPSSGRRVVLSTNVAETSLTVPGVRYVIDSGLARVSRYSAGAKVQRLPVEKISRAAADQRKGRCGRVQSGVCIRLYAEDDYASRVEFTDPEIVRTSLASVVLKMKALRLGEIDGFPFLDAPDARQVRSAVRLLHELGALDDDGLLTPVGGELASLPLDPRIGRLLVEGERQGCLAQMLILAAYLSIPDPRVVPREQLEKARRHHAEVPQADDDINAALALYRDYDLERAGRSRRALERWCRTNFLAPVRMREWAELREQLATAMRDNVRRPAAQTAGHEAIAIAFLAGFLSHVAFLEEKGEWRGANNKVIAIHPASRSFRKKSKWIVAAELVETTRVYAREVLPVRPEWVERAAAGLIKVAYSEPWWDEKSGNVMACKSGTLFGLAVYARRSAHFGPVDPAASRQVFINEALCSGAMSANFDFARHNRALLDEAELARRKLRLPYAAVDERALFGTFDAALPPTVYSRSTLAKWLKADPGADAALRLTRQSAFDSRATAHATDYPATVTIGAATLSVHYRFGPGNDTDGVSVALPLPLLNQFDADDCLRQIPGWCADHVEALLRTLPKAARRNLQPIAARAAELSQAVSATRGPLTDALAIELSRRFNLALTGMDFDIARVPPHLRLRVELVDRENRVIDADRDVDALRSRHGEAATSAFSGAATTGYPRTGIRAWNFGDLPESVPVAGYGTRVHAFPALVDRIDHVDVDVFDHAGRAVAQHREGVLRLVKIARRRLFKDLMANPALSRAVLQYAGMFPGTDLSQPVCDAVIESAVGFHSDPPRRQSDYERRLDASREALAREAARICADVEQAVAAAFKVRREIESTGESDFAARIGARVDALVGPGFPFRHPLSWLPHLPRFLTALSSRIEKFAHNPASERENLERLKPFVERLVEPGAPDSDDVEHYRFLLEEFQVSLYAQHLKTSVPVSPKRLEQAWHQALDRQGAPPARAAARGG